MSARRVNVFLPTLVPTDAVSDQARAHTSLLREWGLDARLVAERTHPDCRGQAITLSRALRDRAGAAWLVHYGIWSDGLLDVLATQGRPKVFTYHNITPAEMLPPGPVADLCRRGRDGLVGLATAHWDLVTTVSRYNAEELRAAGFGDVEVVPLLLPHGEPPRQVTRDDSVLFVGRLAPNKGLDDLMKAVALLRLRHRPGARLDIVGSRAGWEGYAAGLDRLAQRLGDGITFHGSVSNAERDRLYARAGVVCLLSRHEGFCAPLVEAMRAGAPVVARDAGAVGETLGGGGVLLPDGDPALAAEALERVLADAALRARLREGARATLAALEPAVVARRLEETVGRALGVRR